MTERIKSVLRTECKGQTDVIQHVLDSTNIHPETISYIEAHGTGTTLGDPIEMSALRASV